MELSEEEIEQLQIHFCFFPPKHIRDNWTSLFNAGLYVSSRHEIYIFVVIHLLYAFMRNDINNTLAHELRHYSKHGYTPGEEKLPWHRRPSEIDACKFAKQHAYLQCITIPGSRFFYPSLLLLLISIEMTGLLSFQAIRKACQTQER
jgi:hypothetical protein